MFHLTIISVRFEYPYVEKLWNKDETPITFLASLSGSCVAVNPLICRWPWPSVVSKTLDFVPAVSINCIGNIQVFYFNAQTVIFQFPVKLTAAMLRQLPYMHNRTHYEIYSTSFFNTAEVLEKTKNKKYCCSKSILCDNFFTQNTFNQYIYKLFWK